MTAVTVNCVVAQIINGKLEPDPDKPISIPIECADEKHTSFRKAITPRLGPKMADVLIALLPPTAIKYEQSNAFWNRVAEQGPVLYRDSEWIIWDNGHLPDRVRDFDDDAVAVFLVPFSQYQQLNEERDKVATLTSLPTKRPRPDELDEAIQVIKRLRTASKLLPDLNELREFIERPLSDDQKLILPDDRMRWLLSAPSDSTDVCTLDDIRMLFREGLGHSDFDRIAAAVSGSPPQGGSESAWIYFWDCNYRKVVEFIRPDGHTIRDSNKYTNTGRSCPDFAFILDKQAIFRGEEKPPESDDDPKKELSEKLLWLFGSKAPYVLGYHAIGSNVTLAAITPPVPPHRYSVVHDIVSANLRLRVNRIKNICRLIQLVSLFGSIAELTALAPAEFKELIRANSRVEIAGQKIFKTYTGYDKIARFDHTKYIYQRLKEKNVPYVDFLMHSKDTTLILFPRGIDRMPKDTGELLHAISCVLETLTVLHATPTMLHRDIRWSNVIKHIENSREWILIDWEHATPLPAKAEPDFNSNHHHPSIHNDDHGPEVDIWGVGDLVESSGILQPDLTRLAAWMKGTTVPGTTIPSAEEALARTKEIGSRLLGDEYLFT